MRDSSDATRPAVVGILVGVLGVFIAVLLAFSDIQFILLTVPFGAGASILSGTALVRARESGSDRGLARVAIAAALLPFISAALAVLVWGLTRSG